MRITNQMMLQSMLHDVAAMRKSLAAIQDDVTSQKKIRAVSDNPVAATRVMRLEHRLRATEQYRQNSTIADTRLAVEDQVIETARDLVGRATGLALSVTTDSPSDPARQAALAEVNLVLDTIVAIGNTRVGNEYVFSGGDTATPPFQADGTYVGGSLVRQIEIDDGLRLETNHTGDELLGSTIQALQDVVRELQTGTQSDIQAAAVALGSTDQDLLASQSEIGARQRQVDVTDRHLATREQSMLDEREDIQRVDSGESLLKIISAQQAIEQAYKSIARVLDTSLVHQCPAGHRTSVQIHRAGPRHVFSGFPLKPSALREPKLKFSKLVPIIGVSAECRLLRESLSRRGSHPRMGDTPWPSVTSP